MLVAGEEAAALICSRYPVKGRKITVVCGNGNNGGDGFVIAAALSRAGAQVQAALPMGKPKTDTARACFAFPGDVTVCETPDTDCDIVVDALFGIGLDRPVGGELGELIDRINLSDAVTVSIDLPSGVLCDGGVPGKAVRADFTVTMIALKPCIVLPPASEYCGEVAVAPIGISPADYAYLTTEQPVLPRRAKTAHKGTYGTALLLCGSYGMCGAEILAALAALRCGVGIAQALVCDRNYTAFCTRVPEAVTLPVPTDAAGAPAVADQELREAVETADALLIGCGLGRSAQAQRIVKNALADAKAPVVLDADGINAVSSDINRIEQVKAPLILTPHPGEMARLCHTTAAAVEADRVGAARGFAVQHGCILVLKGADTVIAAPDGRIFFNRTGNPGMATGGSGDVLAGMIVSFLAQGVSPLRAALDAVWLHGRAGDLAAARLSQYAMLPEDLIDELKTLVR